MNELIMPHNIGVKNALENMKEVLALYKRVIGNYRPLLDGERYLTDREVAQILKVSRRTLQEYRNDGVLLLLGGEVGLSGEVRPVARIEQRIAEAEKLGFSHIIIPKYNLSGLNRKKFNIELIPVRKVEEALRALFG